MALICPFWKNCHEVVAVPMVVVADMLAVPFTFNVPFCVVVPTASVPLNVPVGAAKTPVEVVAVNEEEKRIAEPPSPMAICPAVFAVEVVSVPFPVPQVGQEIVVLAVPVAMESGEVA